MPAPRPRFRVIAVPGRRPIASAYSPKPYAEWQKRAAAVLKSATGQRFEGPVAVSLIFAATRPKTTKLSHPKPDVDNYAKALLDAVTKDGRFWSDDTQVVSLSVDKVWAPLGVPGFVDLIIKEL